jgi:hypothetical protein
MKIISAILFLLRVAVAQTPGTFTATGNMTTPRQFHTATLLPNGKVLVVGGNIPGPGAGSTLASAELYDPLTGTFAPTGSMIAARRLHTATLLPNGRVLISGGYGVGNSTPATSELFDPATGTFTATADMIQPRGGHTAILLANGKVLTVGGTFGAGPMFAGAELYDPSTSTFSATGRYAGDPFCDFCAPAFLLSDGNVLFAQQSRAQLYNPVTGTFSVTGATSHCLSSGTLLMNGKVLFAGGECDEEGRSSRAELYDPATGTFASTGNMAWSRVWHTLTLLPDGAVLAAGGETDTCLGNFCAYAGSVASAELYDPSAGAFAALGSMTAPREVHTATLLSDGRVLIAGGMSGSVELYTPSVLAPAPALPSLSGAVQGQGAILHALTQQLVSPENPATIGEALEVFLTGLTDGGTIPPQVTIGGRMAEVLYFGNAPGFAGGNQVNVRVPSGVAPGAAVPVRLTYLSRPSNEVTIGVR